MDVGMVLSRKAALFRHVYLNGHARGCGSSHVVLEGKYVLDRAIVAFGPDRILGPRLDQVDGDPQLVSNAPQPSRQKVSNTELIGNLTQRPRLGGRQKGRMTSNHHQVAETAQIGNQVRNDALAKME